MNTVPDTTFTTTDLPGTGGGGGGAVQVDGRGLLRARLASRDAVAVDVGERGERVGAGVRAGPLIAAVPSAPVVTAPAPGLAPAIA